MHGAHGVYHVFREEEERGGGGGGGGAGKKGGKIGEKERGGCVCYYPQHVCV